MPTTLPDKREKSNSNQDTKELKILAFINVSVYVLVT